MFFRAVVPDTHAHVLPRTHVELGDRGTVKFADQPLFRVQTRIGPCHVRAVASILAVLLFLILVLIAVLAALIAALVLAVLLGHDYHLAVSMPRFGGVIRGCENINPKKRVI